MQTVVIIVKVVFQKHDTSRNAFKNFEWQNYCKNGNTLPILMKLLRGKDLKGLYTLS